MPTFAGLFDRFHNHTFKSVLIIYTHGFKKRKTLARATKTKQNNQDLQQHKQTERVNNEVSKLVQWQNLPLIQLTKMKDSKTVEIPLILAWWGSDLC